MLQTIVEPFVTILVFGIGYIIGYIPISIGVFGAMEPGPIDRTLDYSYYRAKGMRWWHVTYEDNGTRYIPAEGVAFIGWFHLGLLLASVWLLLTVAG